MNNERRLTPNQRLTSKFPNVGEKKPSAEIDDWYLEIGGLVRRRTRFFWTDVMGLPQVERVWDTICVTRWTHLDHRWTGVLLTTVLSLANPRPEARFVRFEAYSERQHDTSLPLEYACTNVLLAHQVDGESLTVEHGAPLRSVCNGKYFYKSIKWIKKIELLAEDQLGYWERTSAYHNEANPQTEQRYTPRPMSEADFSTCISTRNFADVQAILDKKFSLLGKDKVDLSGANFEGAQIKSCDFRRAMLRGAKCRRANFTGSTFKYSDMQGADLSGCDCEGARFQGANLSGADLRGASLTAAEFADMHSPPNIQGAKFRRRDLDNDGVDEKDRAFLLDKARGAIVEED